MIQQNRERGKKTELDKSHAAPLAVGEEEEDGDGEGALPKVMALERSSSLLRETEVSGDSLLQRITCCYCTNLTKLSN